MRSHIWRLLIPLALVGPVGSSVANSETILGGLRNGRRVAALQDLSRVANSALPGINAAAEVSTKDKRVKAGLTIGIGDALLGLTVAGPLPEGSSETRLADLNGLRAATSARVEATYVHWTTTADAEGARRFCREYWRRHPAKAVKDTTCKLLNFHGQDRKDFEAASKLKWGRPWFFSGAFEAGRQKLNYADAVDAHEVELQGSPSAVALGVGRYNPKERVFWAASYRYQRGFKSGKEAEFLTPFGSGGFRSNKLPLGPPKKTREDIFTAEVRHFLTERVGIGLAMHAAPQSDQLGIELPLLLRTADEGFRSGVILGWRGQRDAASELSLAAFTGITMGLNVLR